MSEVMAALRSFFQMLLRNKGKILLIPLIAIAWIPFLFPYSDLRSVVATTLSRAIGDGTAIDFDHAALSFGFPIALELENFEFEAPGLPPVSMDRLVAKPSLASIFTRSPAGTIKAEGLFKGSVTASLASGAKLKSGGSRQEIKAEIAGLQLSLLTDALRRVGLLGFNVQGSVETNANVSLDPNFEDQPTGDVSLQAKSVSIPSVSVPIPNMGPIQTPSLQLGKVDFTGKLAEGKVQIENFSFGQGKDSLTGRIRGELGLNLRKADQRVQMVPGAYDLRVDLNVSQSLMDTMTKSGVALALLLIEKCQSTSGDTLKYSFRIRGPAFGAPANPECTSPTQ